jgi:phage terminase large subunit GpA-like protein
MLEAAPYIDYSSIAGLLRGLQPDPIMTVNEWADKYRKLPNTSARPGDFDTGVTPYLKEIMEKLSVTNPAQKIIFKKCSQIGATECGNNWLGYIMDIAPCAMLYVMPTDTLMKTTSATRIQPMINTTPTLGKKIRPARSRDGGNTMMRKEFEGGMVLMVGANSPNGVSSTPVKVVYLDEMDRYPANIGGEGDVLTLASTRTVTHGDTSKIFCTSTPTIAGSSIIDKEFKLTGQRYYNVPCPDCGTYQVLKLENLCWEPKKYDKVSYKCEICAEKIAERFKKIMLPQGSWIAKFPELEDGITFGYHLNALYSPYGWYSWAKMAKEYDEALDDLPKMIAFVNTKKGEVYETSGDAPDWQQLYNKREDYELNVPNEQVIFITAGVDIQPDRIEVEIVGWGAGKQSWSIDYRIFLGSTSSESNEVWANIAAIVDETWTRQDGAILPLRMMCVDSGNNTNVVYAFCRKFSTAKVIPIKGKDEMAVLVSQPKSVDTSKSGKKINGVKVWMVGVSLIKTELYGWLKLQHLDNEEYPHGYCHFPMYDEQHFRSLTAEQVEYEKDKKGYGKLVWKKKYERNERLDCRVYARAAAYQIGIDRLTDEDWQRLNDDTKDMITEKQPEENQTKQRKWSKTYRR